MQISPIQNRTGINTVLSRYYNTPSVVTDKTVNNSFDGQVSFNARIHKYAKKGDWEGIQKELKKGVSINLRDKYGRAPLYLACIYKHENMVENMLKIHNIDVNAQAKNGNTALIGVCERGYYGIEALLLRHRDIDVEIRNNLDENATGASLDASNADLIYEYKYKKQKEMYKKLHEDLEANLRNTIGKQLREEARAAAKIELEKEIKETESYYSRLKEANELDKATLKKMNDALTRDERELKRRESILNATIEEGREQIRKEEREAVENALRRREHILAYKEHETREKNAALDNLIRNYKSLLAADVQHERDTLASGLRVQYGINLQNLPDNMSFGEQLLYVTNILVKRQNKLTHTDNNTPERITKALQGDNETISNEGLKFLENVIDTSHNKVSENDLIAAINSVKGNHGLIDMNKSALFITNLSWGTNTVSSVIQKIEQYGMSGK